MLRMGFHDLAGCNGATDFFNMAIGVYYANNVEGAAWKNARDAAPDGVLHGSFSLCNSHRERGGGEEEIGAEEETSGEGKRRYMNEDKREREASFLFFAFFFSFTPISPSELWELESGHQSTKNVATNDVFIIAFSLAFLSFFKNFSAFVGNFSLA